MFMDMAFNHEFSSDWAWLPKELLDSILLKLIPLSDYIRFTAVCKPWRSVAIQPENHRHINILRNQIPMLLLPPINAEESHNLYSVTNGKVYKFTIPLFYKNRLSGSSHGWLFTVEQSLELVLINPFSGGTIRLPPVPKETKIPIPVEFEVVKASLTANPTIFVSDYAIVAICGIRKSLAYFKSGEKRWTNFPQYCFFSDVINYRGCIYAVDHWSKVITIDINGDVKVVAPRMSRWYFSDSTYLVESSVGDLLLIERSFIRVDRELNRHMTWNFKVFKLNFRPSEELERVEVKSLGGDALFLGNNYSMSVLASDFPGCCPNSIYFTDDYFMVDCCKKVGRRDFGIFSFDDGSFKSLGNFDRSPKHVVPAVWILPTMQGHLSSFV